MRDIVPARQKEAREILLETHRPKIIAEYGLPSDDLHYDDSKTELEFEGEFVGRFLYDKLHQADVTQTLIGIRLDTRKKLLASLEDHAIDPVEQWNLHQDYESLVMDKMLDLERIPPSVLTVQSGETFFKRQAMYSLMHQGYQLVRIGETGNERSDWFRQWNDAWYTQMGHTKKRILDILHDFGPGWVESFAATNTLKYSSIDEVFEGMKDLQRMRMECSGRSMRAYASELASHPEHEHYYDFTAHAMEYNDELRLLRSRSVYRFLRACEEDKVTDAFERFLEVMGERKEKIAKEYSGVLTK